MVSCELNISNFLQADDKEQHQQEVWYTQNLHLHHTEMAQKQIYNHSYGNEPTGLKHTSDERETYHLPYGRFEDPRDNAINQGQSFQTAFEDHFLDFELM